MCGLVGIFGDIKFAEEKAFKTLLTLDLLRGKHSTGVAGMSHSGFKVAKAGLNAVDFMDLKEFAEVMKPVNRCLMGHNRYATIGAINDQNAHPFEFSNIIGAHNGSLKGGWRKFHKGNESNVDSEALYSELNENGVEALWGKLQGAAALTWINKQDKTINFLRNSERELFYVTANQGKTLLWASEDWMLYVAAGREGVKTDGKPTKLPVNQHIKFSLPTKFGGELTSVSKNVEPYTPPKVVYSPSSEIYSAAAPTANLKKFQDEEGVKPGDIVDFTIDMLRDYIVNGTNKCNVIGSTINGTPVRILGMDSEYYSDILSQMEMLAEGIFSGRVTGEIITGLTVAHATIALCATSIEEYIMGLDNFAEKEEDYKEKRDIPANEEEKQQDKQDNRLTEAVVVNLEAECSACYKKTRAFHLIEGKRVCLSCAKTKMH